MDHAEALEKAYEVTVAGYNPEGVSSQKLPDEVETPEKAIEPPLSLDSLARLSQISAIRSAVIDAIARNTVGLGYSVAVASGHEEHVGDPREDLVHLESVLEILARRDEDRLDRPSFTELLVAVKTDEEEVGWGFIEVSRSKLTGKPDGLFHVPGKLMRRLKDRSGYVLLDPSGERNTEFYNFGTKVKYAQDGEPQSTLQDGKSWATNEVISFRLYSSESRDYGMPRDIALALEYAGDKLAAEYNVSFFNAGGTPPTVLFVSSGQDSDLGSVKFAVPQETVSRIANTIKSDGGHRDRVAIVPLPPNSNVQNIKLGEVSDRDMGFVNYRKDNAERILSAFRVQPIFVGFGSDGRYDAEVQRALTLEQVFDPEQDRYEQRLRDTLLKDLGFAEFALKFSRMAVESDQAQRDSAVKMGEAGSISRREYRAAFGYGPLPEAEKDAQPEAGQVHHGWNDEIVDTGTPKGAENRSLTDNRGLQPGVGSRDQRSTNQELANQANDAVGQLRAVTGQSA